MTDLEQLEQECATLRWEMDICEYPREHNEVTDDSLPYGGPETFMDWIRTIREHGNDMGSVL